MRDHRVKLLNQHKCMMRDQLQLPMAEDARQILDTSRGAKPVPVARMVAILNTVWEDSQ